MNYERVIENCLYDLYDNDHLQNLDMTLRELANAIKKAIINELATEEQHRREIRACFLDVEITTDETK